ncbi:polysaccharide pyruvyl transferase family protein [Streptomyces sp. DSM 40750]|uniref:polysaccharide pyruvyl transferase family protein n=1 Tax=Streptomyces sp. DSM 40750 TaxID=2801030 RepID=UPI00214C6440|nr:polysaccharide pyruvyl transferase family protein [Streptomyces sp. DSM 40750]UUU21787.1 polysaccharide pyruvyl transferase family protein [Streptomyces sp. DSM 40750]
MIVVLHAYSRGNAGDGLLIDETLALLERLGTPAGRVRVVAHDADSFSDLPDVISAHARGSGMGRRVLGAAALLSGLEHPVRTAIGEAEALLAVGGGFLRSGRWEEGARTMLAHGGQLRAAAAAARRGIPALYLPASIGPLRGPTGRLLRRWLMDIPSVFVRDDRSLGLLPHACRFPDLALLRLARTGVAPAEPRQDGPVLVAARSLPGRSGYSDALRSLFHASAGRGDLVPVAQACVGSNNDDRAFWASTGLTRASVPTLGDALATARPAVVVSVRLHGAVTALLAGVPAIHLSYERKGPAAFSDLGLERWLHSARSFDPVRVRAQIDALKADPESYWGQVRRALPRLRAEAARLDVSAARALGLPAAAVPGPEGFSV